MRIAYPFEEIGIIEADGWQAGMFTGRIEIVVEEPPSTERYPIGDHTVPIRHRAQFALGAVEVEYRYLDRGTQTWKFEMRAPPESVQHEIKRCLIELHWDHIEEFVDRHPVLQGEALPG